MSRGGNIVAIGKGFDAVIVSLILAVLFFFMLESVIITTALRKGIPLQKVSVLMSFFLVSDQ